MIEIKGGFLGRAIDRTGPSCESTIRYEDKQGRLHVKRQGEKKKDLSMGTGFRQGLQQFFTQGPFTFGGVVSRYAAVFNDIPSDTVVEYKTGCKCFWHESCDWKLHAHEYVRSPNYDLQDQKDITFAVVSDLWPKVTQNAWGAQQSIDDMTFKYVQESIRANTLRQVRENPHAPYSLDFILMPGDVSNFDGCALEYYQNLFPEFSLIEKTRPIYKVWGNHDYHCDNGYNLNKINFGPVHPESFDDLDVDPLGDNQSKSYYHVHYGKLNIFALNVPNGELATNNREGTLNAGYLAKGEPQYEWLKQELENLPEDSVKVVFFHAFTGCEDPSRIDLCELLQNHQVDLIFNGHWEVSDPQQIDLKYTDSKPPVHAFITPSGGVCRPSVQGDYGPRCSRRGADNFLGYYIVNYLPGLGKIEIKSVAVNQERRLNRRPVYSHEWIYYVTDQDQHRAHELVKLH